jgi:hypothetical protein
MSDSVQKISALVDQVAEDPGLSALSEDNRVRIAVTIFIHENKKSQQAPKVTDPTTGKGRVEGILQKRDRVSGEGKKGIWYRFDYTVGGNTYSTFDAGVAGKLASIDDGDLVELSIARKGEHENIVDACKLPNSVTRPIEEDEEPKDLPF